MISGEAEDCAVAGQAASQFRSRAARESALSGAEARAIKVCRDGIPPHRPEGEYGAEILYVVETISEMCGSSSMAHRQRTPAATRKDRLISKRLAGVRPRPTETPMTASVHRPSASAHLYK